MSIATDQGGWRGQKSSPEKMDWFKGNKIQYNSIFHGKIYAFNGKIYGFNEKIYGFNGNIYGFNKKIYGCRLRFSLQPIL